jgi:hypothetical protein
LNISDIRILKEPLVLATPAEVDALEARLWVTFPAGYRDYVTRLGEGVLGGSFVRVYPPWRIGRELGDWRRRIGKYWHWERSRELLPKERALECVIVGDTVNGDELVFHPARPNRLFVLPRDGKRALVAGSDLLAAVEWMCSSGELTKPFGERDFAPFDSRKEAREDQEGEVADPDGESLDEIVTLAVEWAKRRNALKSAQKSLREQAGKDKKTALLYQALVLEGKYPYEPGYLAVFRVEDKASGLEVGTFRWSKGEDSEGSEYSPNHANLAKLRKPKE